MTARADRKVRKFITPKTVVGVSAGIVVGALVLYKIRVNNIVEGVALAYNEEVQEAFDNGVRYGIQLMKDTGLVEAAKEGSQYAFAAFDKTPSNN